MLVKYKNPLSIFEGYDPFSSIFETFFDPFRHLENHDGIQISEKEDKYLVRCEVPGLSKEDLNVNIENGVLTVTLLKMEKATRLNITVE